MVLVRKLIKGQISKLQTKFLVLLAVKKRKKAVEDKTASTLPVEIWAKIFLYLPAHDLPKLKRVCKDFDGIVNTMLSTTLYLNVFRVNSEDLLSPDDWQDAFTVSLQARFALHAEAHRMTILVQERCTARDVTRIFGAIRYFGKFVHTVTVDASIFELMVAGLSSMDLTRWHALQGYLKAINDTNLEDTVHVHCIKSSTDTVLLPNVSELTICVPPNEYSCLSRLMDYGVSSSSIYSTSNLTLLRLNLLSYQTALSCSEDVYYRRRCNQHIRSFKHWSNATSLREKYCHKYSL